MNTKAEELELRNIMQGLEEFATFMSFQGNANGLRILSVETVDQHEQLAPTKREGHVINRPQAFANPNNRAQQSLNKSLSFQDRELH